MKKLLMLCLALTACNANAEVTVSCFQPGTGAMITYDNVEYATMSEGITFISLEDGTKISTTVSCVIVRTK